MEVLLPENVSHHLAAYVNVFTYYK